MNIKINYANKIFTGCNTIQTTDYIQGIIQMPIITYIVGAKYTGINEERINGAVQQLNDGFAAVGFRFVRYLPQWNDQDIQRNTKDLLETKTTHFSINPQAGNEYTLFADVIKEKA